MSTWVINDVRVLLAHRYASRGNGIALLRWMQACGSPLGCWLHLDPVVTRAGHRWQQEVQRARIARLLGA